jgi:4'-phosphopantetheinyl transferase
LLRPDEIHVWSARLDRSERAALKLEDLLSADEKHRAARFRFPHDRNRYVVRRGILRSILGAYLQTDPTALSFAYGHYGKPQIVGPIACARLRFNVSHRQGLALYAFSLNQDLGVDVEFPRAIPDAQQVSERFFSVRENTILRSLPLGQRHKTFFHCWTRKEAFIKAVGEGLSYPLHRFDVAITPGEQAQLLSIDGNAEQASRWLLQELNPAPGYIGALAVQGRDWQVICRHYETELTSNTDFANPQSEETAT